MRRWYFMAALGAASLAIPLSAQRAGRGAMAMGGAAGGHLPQRGGVAGVSRYGSHGFVGHNPSHPIRIHHPFFRCPDWRGCGFPVLYGYPLPYGWYGMDWSSGTEDTYAAQSAPGYESATADNLRAYISYDQQQQIDRLNEEVARLSAERVSQAPPNRGAQPSARTPTDTVLVFRDHHTEEVQNYAIAGRTLWLFSEQRARKFAVSDLDLVATTKANEERGIEFRLPKQ
jgi:hypothetical protein